MAVEGGTLRRREPLSWADLGLLVPFALAGLSAGRGHAASAAVFGTLGLVVVVLRVVAGDLVPRTTARVAHRAQAIITWIAVTAFWLVVVIPGWLLRKLGRTDRHPPPHEQSMWLASAGAGAEKRSFAAPVHEPRRPGSRVLTAVGLVVLLVAIDAGVGGAWQGFTRSKLTAPLARRVGVERDGTYYDYRADQPALKPYPWAESHLRDMQHLPQAYWPFELDRPLPFKSDTVQIDGWSRKSYEPAAVAQGKRLPVVAFYGGSTTFGEGQRDEHTIASEVARLAEEAGTPIRVINYGQRSWTAWQEAMLFEQFSSHPNDPDHPDLVVFYDGANEVLQQRQDSTAGWPTHFAVDGIAKTLTGTRAGGSASHGLSQRSLLQDITDWYVAHSMAIKGMRAVRRGVGLEPKPGAPYTSRLPPGAVGRNAATVYNRAQDFVEATAKRRGIPTVMFWQPTLDRKVNQAMITATDRVGPDTVHIEDTLDSHPEVYFDQVHTNEVGSKIVAERIWKTLKGKIPDAG